MGWGAIKKFIDTHYSWLQPSVTTAATLSGAFWQIEVSPAYIKHHPVAGVICERLIDALIPACVIFTIIALFMHFVHEKNRITLKNLEEELSSSAKFNSDIRNSIKSLFDSFLFAFAKSVGFDGSHDDRVTLYIHDGGSHFIPFGRFSYHPEFSKEGRQIYPDNEGCISKGWNEGWHFYKNFGHNPKQHRDLSIGFCNIKPSNYKKIRMKSQMYAVKAIWDEDSKKMLGVLVVESLNVDKYDEVILRKKIESNEAYIAVMIAVLCRYIPNINQARRLGF